MNLIDAVEAQQLKSETPDIRPGDTLKVHMKIVEGEKERVQLFEGVLIRLHGGGIRKTMTVRKISFGVGVERIFPIHSPRVEKIEVVKRANVRQARLYYLRELRGKAARLKEKRVDLKAEKKPRSKAKSKKRNEVKV
mgnify:CR=1 FL=1|tara:strand:- start:159 stop:569 length:411 start_codon:yes stop_codon:yes gene_type:complete